MTEVRTQDQGPATADPREFEETLVVLTVLLAGGPDTDALADALTTVLPLAAFLGSSALARMVAEAASEIGLVDVPEVSDAPQEILRQTAFSQLSFRAAYIRASVVRLANKVREARRTGVALREALGAWQLSESSYFGLHQEAGLRRQVGAQQVVDAMDQYGEVVGWHAEIRPTSRPNHRAAHRHNWRPALGPPLQTGAYPGVLRLCLCSISAPIPGAPEIR